MSSVSPSSQPKKRPLSLIAPSTQLQASSSSVVPTSSLFSVVEPPEKRTKPSSLPHPFYEGLSNVPLAMALTPYGDDYGAIVKHLLKNEVPNEDRLWVLRRLQLMPSSDAGSGQVPRLPRYLCDFFVLKDPQKDAESVFCVLYDLLKAPKQVENVDVKDIASVLIKLLSQLFADPSKLRPLSELPFLDLLAGGEPGKFLPYLEKTVKGIQECFGEEALQYILNVSWGRKGFFFERVISYCAHVITAAQAISEEEALSQAHILWNSFLSPVVAFVESENLNVHSPHESIVLLAIIKLGHLEAFLSIVEKMPDAALNEQFKKMSYSYLLAHFNDRDVMQAINAIIPRLQKATLMRALLWGKEAKISPFSPFKDYQKIYLQNHQQVAFACMSERLCRVLDQDVGALGSLHLQDFLDKSVGIFSTLLAQPHPQNRLIMAWFLQSETKINEQDWQSEPQRLSLADTQMEESFASIFAENWGDFGFGQEPWQPKTFSEWVGLWQNFLD